MMNVYSHKYGVSQVMITYCQTQAKLWHVITAIYEYSAMIYMSLYSTHEGMAVSF